MAKQKPKKKPAPPTRITDAPARKTGVATSKAAPQEMTGAGVSMPRVSKYQSFVPIRIARRDIKNAPYNPRVIDAHARKNLLKLIKDFGLFNAVVWNKRSGNLVGGHQRLAILDALEGSPDYSLDVDMVDVDDKTEIEMNLAHNNPDAQGTYDPAKLEELFNGGGVDFTRAGFSSMTLQALFPESPRIDSMFSVGKQPLEVQQAVGDIDELQELQRQEIARQKAEKKAHREKAKDEDDTEWHILVICENREERESIADRLTGDPNARYIHAPDLLPKLK